MGYVIASLAALGMICVTTVCIMLTDTMDYDPSWDEPLVPTEKKKDELHTDDL